MRSTQGDLQGELPEPGDNTENQGLEEGAPASRDPVETDPGAPALQEESSPREV